VHTLSRMLVALALGAAAPAASTADFGNRTPSPGEWADALAPAPAAGSDATIPSEAGAPRATRRTRDIVVRPAPARRSASANIAFAFGSSAILPSEDEKLSNLAQALASERLRDRRYEIIGHTDAVGPLSVNLRLSQQRAESVAAFLARRGIDHARLRAEGRGPAELRNRLQPDAPENRRVEIRLLD